MALLLEKGYKDNLYQSGGREDLSDLISNVDAKSTVFTSLAKKGKKPGNVVMGWQMDKYESPGVDGIYEGTDVNMSSASSFDNPGQNRKLMQNYVQIFRRVFRISNLANEIQIVAGVKSELANGIAKKLVEIKRDMEYTFLSNADADSEDAAGTQNPYHTKGLGSFLHASGTNGGDDDFIPTGFLRPAASGVAGTAAGLTEGDVQNLLKSIYETTGIIRDYDAVVGPTLKRAFTNFTQSITSSDEAASPVKVFNQDASARSFINVIDVFEGDFGRLRLHPSVHISTVATTGSGGTEHTHAQAVTARPYKGFIIPFDMAEIRYGKLPQIKELQDNGGGPARLIEAMAALVIYNPTAFGLFDCTS